MRKVILHRLDGPAVENEPRTGPNGPSSTGRTSCPGRPSRPESENTMSTNSAPWFAGERAIPVSRGSPGGRQAGPGKQQTAPNRGRS